MATEGPAWEASSPWETVCCMPAHCHAQWPGWQPRGLDGGRPPPHCHPQWPAPFLIIHRKNSGKSVINQEIFTFKGFPTLSPLYHGWKCPKCRPNPALFSFGVSACLIGKVKSFFMQKTIWHCGIHISEQVCKDKCTIWARPGCARAYWWNWWLP